MEEDMEVIIGGAGIPHDQASFQAILAESDGVCQIEVVIPLAVGQDAI